MTKSLRAAILTAASAFAITAAFAVAPQSRITQAIDNQSHAELPGTLSPHARPANDAGRVPATTRLSGMTLVFSRTPAQQAALDDLTTAQQNPASPQYHHFLTPDQFGAQFGVSASDIAATESWLQQQGFTIDGVSRSRDRIQFTGTVAQAESAFNTQLHYYATSGGEKHFAPSTALSVPSALASSVLTVSNLSDFRPHSHIKFAPPAMLHAHYTTGDNKSVMLGPTDLGVIYDINAIYRAGHNGMGQSIAIVGQSAIVASDITNFQAGFGYAAKPPTQILVPNTGNSIINTGDEAESDLDLEYSSAMAPGATIYFVYAGADQTADVFTALGYAVQNAVAPIISISYGGCEADLSQSDYTRINGLLQEGATQGQTIITAAGDSGSTGCWEDQENSSTSTTTAHLESVSADFPSTSQYVVGMGGTEIPEADISTTYFSLASGGTDLVSSAISYIPEQVWNDDALLVQCGCVNDVVDLISAGGGGVSTIVQRPPWQTGPGITAGPYRMVPDISLLASPNLPGYIYCSSDNTAWDTSDGQRGTCSSSSLRDASSSEFTIAGGTSFAAPIFAGLVAVLNEAKGYTAGQGLINPELYTLASTPATYASAFHDINVANNGNQCAAGANYCSTAGAADYLSAAGYDEASGLGSIDFAHLVSAWPAYSGTTSAAAFTLAATPVTETAGTSSSTTITVTPSNGFIGQVNLTAAGPSTLTNACYSLATAAVTGASSTTATITVITNQSSCTTGTSPLVAKSQLARNAPHAGDRSSHTTLATFAAGGLFGFLLLMRRRKSLRNLHGAALIFMLTFAAAATASLIGCSNKASGTAPPTVLTQTPGTTAAGTYNITVTGSGGTNSSITAPTTFTLTVN
jgi:subtilase family serine protease